MRPWSPLTASTPPIVPSAQGAPEAAYLHRATEPDAGATDAGKKQ